MSDNTDGPVTKKRRTLLTESNEKQDNAITVVVEAAEKKSKVHKKQFPRFRLKTNGDTASLGTICNERVPLMLTDVQHLLLHSLLGNLNLSQPPRWYTLERCGKVSQTTCLVLEGVSNKHWEHHREQMKFSNNLFSDVVEVLTPSVYNGSLVQELALVPLSEAEKEDIIQRYGSMNLALEVRKDLMIMMRAVFPIGNEKVEPIDYTGKDIFPRTQLILSAWQLIEEGYPMPLKGKLKDVYSDYVMTKDEYEPVTPKSPMFGLDCEMCMTHAGSELTRVSVVNEQHETVYESLVKPYNNITDYLTKYSGITKSLLNDVTKRLEDVQKDLRELFPPDAILVGQSLNIDLHALKMMHPYVIDTSCIFNITGERNRKSKLKVLAREFLNENIQTGTNGHCSVEDSLASLKLVQLKLSKSLEFGDAVHTNRQQYKQNFVEMTKSPKLVYSIFNRMIEHKKSSLIIGCDDITGDYHTYLNQAKETFSLQLKKGKPKKVKLNTVDSVDEVITTLCDAIKDYNFTMAHLKIQVNEENEAEQMKQIDKWIESLWKHLEQSSLCVVVFGGTEDNGVAMVNVKSS